SPSLRHRRRTRSRFVRPRGRAIDGERREHNRVRAELPTAQVDGPPPVLARRLLFRAGFAGGTIHPKRNRHARVAILGAVDAGEASPCDTAAFRADFGPCKTPERPSIDCAWVTAAPRRVSEPRPAPWGSIPTIAGSGVTLPTSGGTRDTSSKPFPVGW